MDSVQLMQILKYVLIALIAISVVFLLYKWMTKGKKEAFEETPNVFRMFYVNWCGHCTRAKPEFKKILNVDQVNGNPLKVLMIDAEENGVLASKFGVSSYPTFILSKTDGSNIQYMGARESDEFMKFLNQNL